MVVMPYSVAVDTSNTWSGVGVSSFASGFSRYSVGDGDFKTVFAEHAEALGVLTQTSPGTRSMRTFTGASGVHAHAFDKGNEMHVKLNVTEGQIPVLIQFVSYDACVADAVEGVAVATGVFVAATPETCASATNDAVRIIATGITPGSIDSTGKVVTAEWTNVVHGGAPASASCPTGATTHDLAVALFTFYDAASTPPAYSFPKTAVPTSSDSDSSYAKKKRRKLLFAGAGDLAGAGADRRVAPRSSSGLRKLKSSSGGRKLKSTETRAKSASRSLLETYTWPAQSTWCELWRADEVCNGNAVDSAEKCPTGPPYNCVWENASCKSQPADMEGFGSYKNGVVNETSFLRTLEASLGGLNCSAAGCGDNSGCVTVNASHCKPSIAGTRQVMTNTSANDAITAYAVAHVMHDVCRVDAPGEDPDACNAIQGCVYQGYCSGEQNNHQSCGQRNSSSCETQNCAWGWNASLSANVCTGTGVGTNGDCADNNSSESCLANTCSFYGCTVNDDYSRVQIATACGAAYEDDYIAMSNDRADWTQVAAKANGTYSSGSSEVNALCGAWVLVSLCETAHAAGANAAETCPPAALAGICSFNSTDGVCDAGVDVQGQWDTSMVVPVLQVINGYGCEASVNCDDPGCFLDGNGDCLVTPATAKQAVEQANGNAVHATWAYQVPLTTDGYCGSLSNNQTACDTHPACVHDGTAVCSMKPGFDHWIVGDACVAASGMTGPLDLLASYSGYQSFENLALAMNSSTAIAPSPSPSLLETYTWPAQSTWCELWRADEVCNGNAVDSAEKCPTGPPYNCVWENASCKSQPADMEGFGSYKNGVVNETSFLRTLEASLGGLNCSAAGCGDNSGCVTVNASHCKPSIAGTRQVMTNTSANDAITAYAVAHVMHDVCRVDAPGEDPDACNAIQGCVYQGYCSGEQNNHQSCGQRNSSSCETQNCAWGWNASLSANVCTGTGVGTNGDCADNNSSESCLANTCSFYGCTVNDDYSRVQIATACGAAYEDDYIAMSNDRADWTQVAAKANGTYSSGSSEVNALCGAWVLVSLCETAHAAGANAAETCPPAALAGICSFNSTDGVCDAGVDVQGQWDTSMVVPVLQVINGYGCEASVNCDDPGCFLDGNGDCLVTPATAKQAVEQANGNAVHATWAYQVPLTTDGYCGSLSNNQTACDTHPACVHDGTAVCSMKPGFDHWIVGDACVAASGMTGPLDLLASYSGYQSFENLALAMNSSTAIAPSPSPSPSPSTGETGCYALSTDTTPIAGCTCHETCAKCGYFNWPNTDDDCVTCADPSVTVTAVYGYGTGHCTPYTGIPARAGADVAGSPCYHVIGSDDPASKQRRGTVRFFCDETGGLTQLKWFATGSPNPGCDMSVPPDELTYGAHSINSRHDLAACDDASEYDVALGRRFPKIEASCGGFDLAAFYSRTDGKVGPFASTYRYRIPVAQRTESAPWGCDTAGCVKARQLGYAV